MIIKIPFLKAKLKNITSDFGLSILASIINTFARQIVVFPILALRMTDTYYGTVLTVVGLINVIAALVGGTLNNIRMIKNAEYADNNLKGDFLRLSGVGSIIGALICVVIGFVFQLQLITVSFLIIYLFVNNFYQYATAYYRINLDFKRNMVANILVSLGYVLGCLVFADGGLWPIIFLIGDFIGLLYTLNTTKVSQETFEKTEFWDGTVKAYIQLLLVNLISNLLMYADRIIIYPILGAESVSYYSTASFVGKSAGIVMVPIAGVLLGYFSQRNFVASRKLFIIVNGCSLVCMTAFLGGCLIFSPWITRLLYPTLYDNSVRYLFLANLGAAISIAGNMAQPMLLKGCATKYLMIIQVVYALIYLICSLLLLPNHGLIGFCIVTVGANLTRLLLFYGLGLWKFRS